MSMSVADSYTYFVRKYGYFNGWEKIIYEMGGNSYNIINFIHRWAFRESFINNTSVFSYWVMRDNETLFSISEILYKSPYHFWIILLFNNLLDPLYSVPMKSDEFNRWLINKYGKDHINDTHHYEATESGELRALPPGTVVSINGIKDANLSIANDYPYGVRRVTNYEYEERENLKRRYLKLMKPEYLNMVLKEKEDITKSQFIHMNRQIINVSTIG